MKKKSRIWIVVVIIVFVIAGNAGSKESESESTAATDTNPARQISAATENTEKTAEVESSAGSSRMAEEPQSAEEADAQSKDAAEAAEASRQAAEAAEASRQAAEAAEASRQAAEAAEASRQAAEAAEAARRTAREIRITSDLVFRRNEYATVTIQAQPNTDYSIEIYYNSGKSTAEGLVTKSSDADGNVSWTWKIGGRTAFGKYRITIFGGGESITREFEVIG